VSDPERESRRIQRQALAMDMLQKLRPALLHELKGPMQAILSALHLLRKSSETEPSGVAGVATHHPQDQYTDLIRNSVQQLIAIGDAMLPRGADEASAREPVRLHALTERALRLLRDLAALESVAFELDVDAAAATELEANKDDLQLALTALLVGMLERAPPDSTVKISIARPDVWLRWTARVAAHPERPNPDRAWVASTASGAAPAAPLGWSVARDIVGAHGGRMTLEDAGGDGWTLELALPVTATT
jgi:cell cycle sensor histidine kinase DivJ